MSDNSAKPDSFHNPITQSFIWLSGASSEELERCPRAEQRKYAAFGATVLVPCVFGLITGAYAVSTLTDNVTVITVVALVWSGIILAVDRAMLSTYRAHQPFRSKIVQLTLRLFIAVLMGLTISHPLTLLVFRDTIGSIIEKGREADIAAARVKFDEEKKTAEARITTVNADIAAARKRWDESFDAKFLNEPAAAAEKKESTAPEADPQVAMQNKITAAQAPIMAQIALVDKDISDTEAQRKSLQAEIDHWQEQFEKEISGKRSGMTGIGPRAQGIQNDQLAPRRAESQRLGSLLDARTRERNDLRAQATRVAQTITAEEAAKASEVATTQRTAQAKMSALRAQIAEQQAGQFVAQQTEARASLKQQLDALVAQEKLLRDELTRLVEQGAERLNAIRTEPRRDILKQTLALHELFEEGAEGGSFALSAYIVLTLLFMLVDTIPIIIKFFSKPGPYDDLVMQQDEASKSVRSSIQWALIHKFQDEQKTFFGRLQKERTLIAETRKAGHEEDARQREEVLNKLVKEFYASQSAAVSKHALEEQARNERAQAVHRAELRRIADEERKELKKIDTELRKIADEERKASLDRRTAEVAGFAEHVSRERAAIKKARDEGHEMDAKHREDALADWVRRFYAGEDMEKHNHSKPNGKPVDSSVSKLRDDHHENGSSTRLNGHDPAANGNGTTPSLVEPGEAGSDRSPATESQAKPVLAAADDATALGLVRAGQHAEEPTPRAPIITKGTFRDWVPFTPPLEEEETPVADTPQVVIREKVEARAGEILEGLHSPDFLSRFGLGTESTQPEIDTPA